MSRSLFSINNYRGSIYYRRALNAAFGEKELHWEPLNGRLNRSTAALQPPNNQLRYHSCFSIFFHPEARFVYFIHMLIKENPSRYNSKKLRNNLCANSNFPIFFFLNKLRGDELTYDYNEGNINMSELI